MKPLILDAHLDLAMNALEWNRDLRWTVQAIRDSERGQTDKPDRAKGTVSFDAMRRGNVGVCVATLIARFVRPGGPFPGWHSQEQAWAQTQGQLAWYRAMEEAGELTAITDLQSLDAQLTRWKAGHQAGRDTGPQSPWNGEGTPADRRPIGYVLSLEGADSIVTLRHLERAHAQGLRAVGPAHFGPGVYAQGTGSRGGIGEKGKSLLREMERLKLILDASHLCDDSFWESLDTFGGPVWASHTNCRALVAHERQFSDEQIEALVARGAVIGIALDAWMLVPGWKGGDGRHLPESTPEALGVNLARAVDHIDRVCQLAGNSHHVGIGSDLDGAFGTEQCPTDVDTIADLQKIPPLLAERGYTAGDIERICGGNYLRFLRQAWDGVGF